MKLRIIITTILLFLFTTGANVRMKRPNVKPTEDTLNFDKELHEIRLELLEADRRNHQLEIITNNDKELKKIKRNIRRNK